MATSSAANTLIRLAAVQARLLKQQDRWLTAHGISYREFVIMLQLRESSERHLKRIDLAERVGLSASGITRLLNPMEKIGLIAKEQGARDARVSLVRLTGSGEALLRDAEASFNVRASELMKHLDAQQKEAMKVVADLRL